MAHTLYVNRIEEQVVPGRRLGRHAGFDSRSLAYPVRAVPVTAKLWERKIPILDQDGTSSCTGQAECGALGTEPVYSALPASHLVLDEAEAIRLYSEATQIDPFPGSFPPDDTGSNGLSVCKAAKNDGLISGYLNAAGVTQMAQALQAGPVIIGINWYSSMDDAGPGGMITISPDAYVRGGHELVVRGVDPDNRTFRGDNSWGVSWGDGGSFTIGWDDMDRLFSEDGDCYEPLPLSVPVPPPVPVPPSADAYDTALWGQLSAWAERWSKSGGLEAFLADFPYLLHHPHVTSTREAARDFVAWARAKGLT